MSDFGKTENEELIEVFEHVDFEISRSRDPRAVRRIPAKELTEEEKAKWKAMVENMFKEKPQKPLDNENQDIESTAYDDWVEEQNRLSRRGPALIDPLNPPEAGRVRKLELENEIRSMKGDIVIKLSSLAEKIIKERLRPKITSRIDL